MKNLLVAAGLSIFLAILCFFAYGQLLPRLNTRHAVDFSKEKFRTIQKGDSIEEVNRVVGNPLIHYEDSAMTILQFGAFAPRTNVSKYARELRSRHEAVLIKSGRVVLSANGKVASGPLQGKDRDDLINELGAPVQEDYHTTKTRHLYTQPLRQHEDYYIYEIRFDEKGNVDGIFEGVSD